MQMKCFAWWTLSYTLKEHGEVCPAGWRKGDKGMKATHQGVAEYLKENSIKL